MSSLDFQGLFIILIPDDLAHQSHVSFGQVSYVQSRAYAWSLYTLAQKVLNALKEELQKLNYLSILFDFEKPANRDTTETLSTLAHLERFVTADITDAKSIPQEIKIIFQFSIGPSSTPDTQFAARIWHV